MASMGRPTLPRVVLPVRYALIDDRNQCRALTETAGGALAAFIQTKFSDDDAEHPGSSVQAAIDALWREGWSIVALRREAVEVLINGDTVEHEDLMRLRRLADEDEFVIWPRPVVKHRNLKT